MRHADGAFIDSTAAAKLQRAEQRATNQRHKWKHGSATRGDRVHEAGCWHMERWVCRCPRSSGGVRPAHRAPPSAHERDVLARGVGSGSGMCRAGHLVKYRARYVPNIAPQLRGEYETETEFHDLEPDYDELYDALDMQWASFCEDPVRGAHDGALPSDGAHVLADALDQALERYDATLMKNLIDEYDWLENTTEEASDDDFELV